MTFKNIQIIEEDLLTRIVINRAHKLNALSRDVFIELREFLLTIKKVSMDGPRLISLESVGDRAFIAGADIEEMSQMNPDDGEEFARLAQEVTMLVESLPIPVVASVDGHALGGGCEMALCCDFIYATKEATFGQPEVNLGLTPGFGGCVRLARAVGPNLARELIYTGRRVGVDEALQIGLVHSVYENREDLLSAVRDLSKVLSRKSPFAISLCKKVILSTSTLPMKEALELERSAFRQAFESEDKSIGTNAFLNKLPPSFVGR